MAEIVEVISREGRGPYESGTFTLSQGTYIVRFHSQKGTEQCNSYTVEFRFPGGERSRRLHITRTDGLTGEESAPLNVSHRSEAFTYIIQIGDDCTWFISVSKLIT